MHLRWVHFKDFSSEQVGLVVQRVLECLWFCLVKFAIFYLVGVSVVGYLYLLIDKAKLLKA